MTSLPKETQNAFLNEAQKEQFIRDGYVVARGLLPPELVEATRAGLLQVAGIDPKNPQTWAGKHSLSDPRALKLTEPCRSAQVEEVAAELVGPHFVGGEAFSPGLASQGVEPPTLRGFIPVLRFPENGPREFVPLPGERHIDGLRFVTLWPDKHFLVVFAYLSDVPEYGGATTVWPGSHRRIFEHWVQTENPGSPQAPDLEYSAPVPLSGKAGDVVFMHYLLAHSGSPNRSEHIRVGLNTAVLPDPARPYGRKIGPPQPDWTPLDWTLRTDNLVKNHQSSSRINGQPT